MFLYKQVSISNTRRRSNVLPSSSFYQEIVLTKGATIDILQRQKVTKNLDDLI